jgi:hypothetical protein
MADQDQPEGEQTPEEMLEDVKKLDDQGQITVPLDGQDYVLRPSFNAIRAIERYGRPSGRALAQFADEASRYALSIDDMGFIVSEFMRAHGVACPEDPLATDYKNAKPDRCAELIYETGVPRIAIRLYAILAGAIAGGYTPSGERRALPEMTTGTNSGETPGSA